jgi:hypothetical protein
MIATSVRITEFLLPAFHDSDRDTVVNVGTMTTSTAIADPCETLTMFESGPKM